MRAYKAKEKEKEYKRIDSKDSDLVMTKLKPSKKGGGLNPSL